MMNDEQETQKSKTETEAEPQAEERPLRSRSVQASPPPPPTQSPDDKTETISLLDLMDGEDDDATITLSDLSAGEAQTPAETPPAPLPLASDELTPRRRPLESDLDATQVRPDLAIPGRRQQQTQPPTDKRPSPPPAPLSGAPVSDSEPTLQSPPQPPSPRLTQPQRAQPQRQPARRQPVRQPPPTQPARVVVPGRDNVPPSPVRRSPGRRNWSSCLLKSLLIFVAGFIVMLMLAISGAAFAYRSIASDLPQIGDLEAKASSFETARIYDRNGAKIFSLADPETGNRTRVSLDRISQDLINATIATEDARFYENPGFDPIGIARAISQAIEEGEAVSGASTITQQLVRALVLSEEERTEITLRRKIREIILAAEMAQKYDKEVVLELYLNEIYYGNLAYGIEAAAQTYFHKSAADLTLAEASLLAGLPQAPAFWDPFANPEGALIRQTQVLNQMLAEGHISLEQAQAAQNETAVSIYNMTPSVSQIQSPHFIFTVLQQAESLLGAQSIYRGGLRIFTTMDPATQQLAETTVQEARPALNGAGANNAAMVVVQPATGEILALVGSVDFGDETIDGQVNMALAPRSTGSSIKPLVYLSAFEQGWTPSTLIWDVPTSFPNGGNPPYQPKNYDDAFHGPLRLRPSLGNSYNIPAVKALEYVGVCNFIANMQKVGIASLQDDGCVETGAPRNHGLSLTLGGGEISPLEMAGAFATLANQGQFIQPFAISRIENGSGEAQFEQTPPGTEAQVVRPEHAYLLSDILSDNGARQPGFGLNNLLTIPAHRVAAKTGTSGTSRFDVRDGWTIGYTPEVVTAVWTGNTDNAPVGEGQSGYQMASPIWNRFMSQYLASRAPVDFVRSGSIIDVEICADSGARPGPGCSNRIVERFAQDQPPLNSDADFIGTVPVDLWTGLEANEHCQESVAEASFFDILVSGRPEVWERERFVARQWLETTGSGQAWAGRRGIAIPLELPPQQACDENTPRPEINITQPQANAEVSGLVEIMGTVKAPNFNGYQVEYGLGENPGGWGLVQEQRDVPVENGLLASWDTADIDMSGPVTLRIILFGPDNLYDPEAGPTAVEERVVVLLLEPTATATPSPTATETSISKPTAIATNTPVPINTPVPTNTPSPTDTPAAPTLTPAPPTPTTAPDVTDTPAPLPTPTMTPAPTSYP
ncbi:MAG: PBP1A family penicillin-binding protein [Chloroflexi bacterium]|nr:PBP1A family penicillin-binding protein [Chloroflexota bacterium]